MSIPAAAASAGKLPCDNAYSDTLVLCAAACAISLIKPAGPENVGFLYSRDRGNRNTSGAGGDTAKSGMWRDFMFSDQRNQTIPNPAAAGMDISISGLQAFAE